MFPNKCFSWSSCWDIYIPVLLTVLELNLKRPNWMQKHAALYRPRDEHKLMPRTQNLKKKTGFCYILCLNKRPGSPGSEAATAGVQRLTSVWCRNSRLCLTLGLSKRVWQLRLKDYRMSKMQVLGKLLCCCWMQTISALFPILAAQIVESRWVQSLSR